MSQTILELRNLSVALDSHERTINLVDGIDLSLSAGETVGLVGESGCGKSLTAGAILGLLPSPLIVRTGAIEFLGNNLLAEQSARRPLGTEITAVFQEPAAALNPAYTIGNHLAEVIARNRGRALPFGADRSELLRQVTIPDPVATLGRYPHQLSGGMKQRAMIAMAIAPGPTLIVADEPTTALDPTTQANVLKLFRGLTEKIGTAVLFISHDIAMLRTVADRIAVMYAGRIVEIGPAEAVLTHPYHPYTQGLEACLPRHAVAGQRLTTIPGTVPPPDRRPSGCAFRDRCRLAEPGCSDQTPLLAPVEPGHAVACPVAVGRRGAS